MPLMYDAAGLWAEEVRKTVLDMDLPNVALDFMYVRSCPIFSRVPICQEVRNDVFS
jgi:hypothetical protein